MLMDRLGVTGLDRPRGMEAPDFGALFRILPSPYMILNRELRYVSANDAYCKVLERRREDLIGRNVFDVFPEMPESGGRLSASFARVLESGQPDTLALIPYPIERPASRGGGFEMRYWSAVNVPLLDADGRTAFIMQNTVDITELQQLKAMAYGPAGIPAPGETDLLQRAREMQAANQSLLRETQDLRDLFMQAPGFMALLAAPDLRFVLVNSAYQQLIGHRAVIGRTVEEALPDVRDQGFVELLQTVLTRKEPHVGRAMSLRLKRAEGGEIEERFVDFIYQPILSVDGVVSAVFVEGSDVTDRVLAERQQKLLLDELNHRVKNSLAIVQAIAHQTLRSSPEPEGFRTAFEARLLAMAKTHDLLTATSWRSASLRDVLLAELGPYGSNHYRLEGPPVSLSPPEALAMGLVVHELATNAAKYGALSSPDGCVRVDWASEGGRLRLVWRENGGPPVSAPTRRGFGSRLIERSLAGALDGTTRLEFRPHGLTCHLDLPLRAGRDGAAMG